MLARSIDPVTGIIHTVATGKWIDADVDDHFQRLGSIIAERRRAGLPIMVLIDVRNAPRPSDAIRLKLKAGAASIYRPSDRVALVAHHPDMKDEVREFLADEGIWSYCSVLAAEQWLLLKTD